MHKSGDNQTSEKIEVQLTVMKRYTKCEIFNFDQNIKSLYECFNGLRETEKSIEILQKNFNFLQNELRNDEITKTLLET